MRPEPLETDPREVLSPSGFNDEPWADELRAGNPGRAQAAFLEILRVGPERTNTETDMIALRRRWFGVDPGEHAGFDLDPDAIVTGRYVGAYGVDHQFENGVDWFHNPTEADEHDFTPEWQWTLNRHYQWMALADAYDATGNSTYANAFERQLKSWIAQCPRPDGSGLAHPSAWRTIEAGIRSGTVWPYVFETFRRCDDVSDEVLWRWVCSFRDHGRHLLRYVTSQNWKAMESNGLAHVGAMFPELDGARTFRMTGVDRSIAELERQFYPDGLQHELAPRYGVVGSLANIYSALSLGAEDGALVVPDRAWERIADVSGAYARLAAPDGRCPSLHDSDYLDVAPVMAEFGGDGTPWTSEKSDRLPWGGYGILRRDDRYAMLDAGPYGAAHQHQDTLQVVGYADGEWLLVDPGAPPYTDSPVTDHLRSAAAHNVVLLDGARHEVRPEVLIADNPQPVGLATGSALDVTAAARTFETVESGVTFDHERVLCDIADIGWLALDRVEARGDRPHAFEWLWQTPGSVTIDGDSAKVDGSNGASLDIELMGTRPTTMSVDSAERDPYRGWDPTGEADTYEPLPSIGVESTEATGGMKMVTLLSPSQGSLRDVTFDKDELSVTVASTGAEFVVTATDGPAGWVDTVTADRPPESETLSLSEHVLLEE